MTMVVLSACGPSVRLYSDIDDTAAFDQYATYSFLDFTEGNKKTITGMELERIRVAFAKEIESRGLSFSEESGDVSVRITVYHRQAARGYAYWGAVGELQYDPEKRAAGLSDLAARIFDRYPIKAAEGI